MNGTVPLWLKGIIVWVGSLAVAFVIWSFVFYLTIPSDKEFSVVFSCFVPLIGPAILLLILAIAQRNDFKDKTAPPFRLDDEVYIEQSQATVFRFLSDPQNYRTIDAQVTSVTLTSPGPFGLGTTYEQREYWVQRGRYTVSRYEPYRLIEVTGSSGGRPVVGTYQLVQRGAGTLVTTSLRAIYTTLEAPFQPLSLLFYRAALRAQSRKLRQILEAGR